MHTEVVIHLMNAYAWCWSKICGSLDEILSLTMGSYESKILNKFLYDFCLICIKRQDFKGQGHYSKVKGQIKVTS